MAEKALSQKVSHVLITLGNVDRFSKLCHQLIHKKILYVKLTRVNTFKTKIHQLFANFSRQIKLNKCTEFVNETLIAYFFSKHGIKIVWVIESTHCP